MCCLLCVVWCVLLSGVDVVVCYIVVLWCYGDGVVCVFCCVC